MRIPEETGRVNGEWVESAVLGKVPGLVHGFSTRALGDFARGPGGKRLLAALGGGQLRLLRQVHGVRVVSPETDAGRPEADAWAGRPRAGVLLGVLTADCLPVLLCHPRSQVLGLAHAGWRGALAGVAVAALKAMDVPAEEVVVALGPCIRACCYQVGEEVAAAAGSSSPHLSPWADVPGRYRLDLPGLVRAQLTDAGVPPEGIGILPLCTVCRVDLFYSHRRDGSRGRMCGFLGWSGMPEPRR